MGWGDLAVAFGKVVSTEVRGALKSVLANLSFLEHEGGADAEFNKSVGEPMYGAGPLFWRPKAPVKAAQATGLNPQGHAEVVALRVGDEAVPVAYRDLRLMSQANPKEGEVVIAQYGGGFISLKDNDDGNGTSITIYALRKNGSGGADKASVIAIDTTASNKSIVVVHENGQSISLTKDGGIVMASPDGQAYIELKNGSIVLNAASILLNGGVVVGTNNPLDPTVLAVLRSDMTPASFLKAK